MVYVELMEISGLEGTTQFVVRLAELNRLLVSVQCLTWSCNKKFSLVIFPYVYLLARTSLLQKSATLMEAISMLDKSVGKSFFMIALPLSHLTIVVGVSLAMMDTLADFGTMQLFDVQTFTTGIHHAWF